MASLLVNNQKLYCVGFEVLTARLLTIKGFWYVTPHRMVLCNIRLLESLHSLLHALHQKYISGHWSHWRMINKTRTGHNILFSC